MSESLVVTYGRGSKIASMLPHEQEAFIVGLRKIATAHGVTNITADDIKYADSFINKFYADFTVFEIPYAFELYAADKLAVEKRKEWNANFNIEFIGAVLNAYKVYKRHALESDKSNKEQMEASKQLPAAPPVEVNWKDYQYERGQFFNKIFTEHIQKEKRMPVCGDAEFESAFDFLVWTKVIKMSGKQRREYAKKLKDTLLKRYILEKEAFKITHEKYKERLVELESPENFATICRAERAREYYKELLQSLL